MKELKMFIAGQFVQNKSEKWIDVLNPATEKVICRQPDGTAEDARMAVEVAEKAQKKWEQTPSVERAAYLKKIAEEIRRRAPDIAEVIVQEPGSFHPHAQIGRAHV